MMTRHLQDLVVQNEVTAAQTFSNSPSIAHDAFDASELESQTSNKRACGKIRSFLTGKLSHRRSYLERLTGYALDNSQPDNVGSLRLRVVEALFSLHIGDISQWPGILIYFKHLEQNQFSALLEPQFDVIWTVFLRRQQPSLLSDASQGWHWCLNVIETFNNLYTNGNLDPSIETVYSALIARAQEAPGSDPINLNPGQKQWTLKAIFAALCWLSATLTPLHALQGPIPRASPAPTISSNSQDRNTQQSPLHSVQPGSLVARNASFIHSSKELRRPVSKLFNAFRNHSENSRVNTHPYANTLSSRGQPSHQQPERVVPETSSQTTDITLPSGSGVLYEACLNYSSLVVIGRIKLEWVDTITAHLSFNRSTRTLCLFQYPSLCAVHIVCAESGNEIPVISGIVNRLLPPQHYTDGELEAGAVYREILLSYRLLFGKSSRSRKLLADLVLSARNGASAAERRSIIAPGNRSAAQMAGVSMRVDENDENALDTNDSPATKTAIETASTRNAHLEDPFLLECTSPVVRRKGLSSYRSRLASTLALRTAAHSRPSKVKRFSLPSEIYPASALDRDGRVQDFDTYSMVDDFPVFGQRLLALQTFNMRQQPSKVTDLWRDRRNPLQWYTFWAVLWVGGASLLLAVLQLAVAIVQTVFGAPSNK